MTTETQAAEIVQEFGPYEGVAAIGGVTQDGEHVWAAAGSALLAIDPASGDVLHRIPRTADAGTAFDGRYLYQIAEARIDKIDPASGQVVSSIPSPGQGGDSGLAWAEGSLWVGEYRARRIHEVDPATGAVRRTLESDRFVTGVTWVDGELWHGTWEDEASEIRRIDPSSGAVQQRLAMPPGLVVSGLESDGRDLFYAGGGSSAKLRVVKKPLAKPRPAERGRR